MGQNGGVTSHFMFKYVGLVGSIHLCPMTGHCGVSVVSFVSFIYVSVSIQYG